MHKIKLRAKIRKIAKAFKWSVPMGLNKKLSFISIYHEKHGEIMFSHREEGKSTVVVVKYRSPLSKYYTNSINVSFRRKTNHIIKDIQKRLLPLAREQYKTAKENKENFDKRFLKNMDMAVQLNKKIKGKIKISYTTIKITKKGLGSITISDTYFYHKPILFEVEANLKTALKVAEGLNG
jgi:hypothetical protein